MHQFASFQRSQPDLLLHLDVFYIVIDGGLCSHCGTVNSHIVGVKGSLLLTNCLELLLNLSKFGRDLGYHLVPR